MRKIESQMINAVAARKNWSSGNTTVQTDSIGAVRVFLHGNQIAEFHNGVITLWDGGWQTTTTKSRLNALMTEFTSPANGVFQKAYEWFIKVDGVVSPFQSGMTIG